MRRKHFRRVLALVTALTVAIGLTVPAGYADVNEPLLQNFSDAKDGELSLTVQTKESEGKTVTIYKVAKAVIENGYIAYKQDEPEDQLFKDAKVELTSTETEWPKRANTLAGYTSNADFLNTEKNPVAKEDKNFWIKKTNSNGSVTVAGLSKGLYLAVVNGSRTYTPALVCLPNYYADKGHNIEGWQKNVTLTPKNEPSGGGGGGKDTTTSISVVKVWKDDGNESDRPDSVTVELLRDGKKYETKTLNKSNNWRYEWKNLSTSSKWVINEVNVPDKYTVLTELEGKVYTVTNTHTTDIDDPNTPLNPGPGPGGDPGTGGDIPPTNINDPDVPLDPGRTPGDNATNIKDPAAPANAAKLPQTGQLWWPVPILAAAGIAFFSIGWLRSRKDESEENK